MKPIRFLFILYYFPPVPGTAAKRNYFISNAISRKAEASHIFTATPTGSPSGIPSSAEIHTLPAWDYRALLRRRTRDGALAESRKRSPLMQWLIRLINTFPVNIIAGEGGLIYFFAVLRHGQRLIEKEKITHLYSSFRPFADHYAAYKLKKKNPHLFWIADFRDLIVDPHYKHILFSKKQQVFFKKIFSKADLLTTVSDGLAAHLTTYNANVITVRNGIAGEIKAPQPQSSPYFTLVYTGSMFLDKRNAEPVFKALKEMFDAKAMDQEQVRIVYAGKDGEYWCNSARKYQLTSILDDRGVISGEEAQRLQESACINILLTVSSDHLQGYLTGKMIEYFSAGSPVLGIISGQNDPELNGLLHELSIGDSWSDQLADLMAIKDFILKEYLHWKSVGTNRKPVDVNVLREKYGMEKVTQVLTERIAPVMKNPV